MDAGSVSVHALAGEISQRVENLLASKSWLMDADTIALLAQFAHEAEGVDSLRHVAAVAASVVAFGRGGSLLDDRSMPQVRHLLQALATALSGEVGGTADGERMVPAVAPSEYRESRVVALYLDDSAQERVLSEMLLQAGFEPISFNTLEQFRDLRLGQPPAAVMIDLGLCSLNPAMASIIGGLRDMPDPVPHIFCIGPEDDMTLRLDAVRFGATRYFGTPLDIARIVAVLQGVTTRPSASPFRVLLIDDDRLSGRVNAAILERRGIETLHVTEPLQARARILSFEPDVIVSDIYMPGCNGLELLAVLRQDEQLVDTPIIFLSCEQEEARRLEATELGADDFLTKPVSASLLATTVLARARRSRALKRGRKDAREMWRRLRELEARDSQRPSTVLSGADSELMSLDDFVIIEPIPRY